ncbi:amidohydrolase family protein [Paenibacillus radicis (ex Xue et al. 2023)]|uniref:Amidohydrolase family protein n=1 Tax=Paenibacillus radicis (ex Xue et al. 2023) TaxID=2972489 RepID=A0ABT1YQW2_9BACL|nr:amidohydrolase family protein [Paenibacillus radicis (ex Xue et al. 2023)]MCR8635120.1 amidohydrolase family protein [Paenibacillus radicis (ex Xue et al. 2023)]
MRVDAHQHFWKLERGDYGWISPDMKAIYKDFGPADLADHLDKNGLDKSIVVQAAPTLQDTEFMLELAEHNESIAGVVGWLDLHSPNYREQYQLFKQHPSFAGIRVMIQAMEDADEVLQPSIVEALRYFAEEGFPVDLLMLSHQLPSVLKLLKAVPNLHGVIDHIAKPQIMEGQWEPWATQMVEIASYRNIYCKLSGMVTEADHQHWKPEQITPYIQHIVRIFGTDRVMFGSDWPVCLLAASYDQVVEVLEQGLPEAISEQDKEALFGGNALRFYRLEHLS